MQDREVLFIKNRGHTATTSQKVGALVSKSTPATVNVKQHLLGECKRAGFYDRSTMQCKEKQKSSNRKVPWWSNKLRKLRKEAGRDFNKAKRSRNWEAYENSLHEYNNEFRSAKRNSWKEIRAARIHKVL